MHLEIQKSKDHTFTWSFYDHNVQEIPVTGTVTVYDNGGAEVVASTAVAIETDGEIKYTLLAANTGTCARNFKIELFYQVGDVKKYPFYLYDVVETPLLNEVRDEDLFTHLPSLRTIVKQTVEETTAAGTTTTFISRDLCSRDVDYKGGFVTIYLDDTTTHDARITAYDKTNGQVTFTPAYTSSIGADLKFTIRSSYQEQIDEAYNSFVHRDIRNKVGLAAGYIDTTITRNMTMFKALAMICNAKAEESEDVWDMRATKYADKYNDEYSKLQAAYDTNEDGSISDTEDRERPSWSTTEITR